MYFLQYSTFSCASDVGTVSVSWQVHQHADDWCRAIRHCPASQLPWVASVANASCVRWCRAVWPLGRASCRRPRCPVAVGRMGCDSCDRWPSNTSRSRPTFRRCPSFVNCVTTCFEAEGRMRNMSTLIEMWIDVYQCWEIYVWTIYVIWYLGDPLGITWDKPIPSRGSMCFGWRLHRDQLFGHDPLRGLWPWSNGGSPPAEVILQTINDNRNWKNYGFGNRFLIYDLIYCVFYDITQSKPGEPLSYLWLWSGRVLLLDRHEVRHLYMHSISLKAPLLKWSGDSGTTLQLSRNGDRHWGPEPWRRTAL